VPHVLAAVCDLVVMGAAPTTLMVSDRPVVVYPVGPYLGAFWFVTDGKAVGRDQPWVDGASFTSPRLGPWSWQVGRDVRGQQSRKATAHVLRAVLVGR
jgi:hypothetical protein